MNSLPLISHHLFVAAVGNESRVQEKLRRPERPSVDLENAANAITLEIVDGGRLLAGGRTRPLRAGASGTRT
jgi:hypothetical protein